MSVNTVDVVCYHYEPVKAPLLLAAGIPAAREAAELGVDAHIERHWLHGPHIRVRLSGAEDIVAAAAQRVAMRLRDHVTARPSRLAMDARTLLEQAAVIGRVELIPPPYGPIQPDNTVVVETVDDRHLAELLGSQGAVSCRAQLLRLGLDPIEEAVGFLEGTGHGGGARVWIALTAMAAHAAAYPGGLASGCHTFLSHVEDFLLHHDDGSLRDRFRQEWRRRADRVVAHVEQTAASGAQTPGPMAAAWSRWTRAARAICGPAYARGELALYPGEQYAHRARLVGDPEIARRWDPSLRTEYSEYHQAMNFDFQRKLGIEQDFGSYRFATNVLYLLLSISDVMPVERYLAAYLLVEAVERITGTSWRQTPGTGSQASTILEPR
ncbi:hypothetical protein [Streptosporangium sp. NPDC000396]|uniref:hypothetical protein n=1 Tax=Streptosporangium sp. NPDC000396 TaxID=3366185 RepID=UPI0036D0DB74